MREPFVELTHGGRAGVILQASNQHGVVDDEGLPVDVSQIVECCPPAVDQVLMVPPGW